jgi:hypothetical protein
MNEKSMYLSGQVFKPHEVVGELGKFHLSQFGTLDFLLGEITMPYYNFILGEKIDQVLSYSFLDTPIAQLAALKLVESHYSNVDPDTSELPLLEELIENSNIKSSWNAENKKITLNIFPPNSEEYLSFHLDKKPSEFKTSNEVFRISVEYGTKDKINPIKKQESFLFIKTGASSPIHEFGPINSPVERSFHFQRYHAANSRFLLQVKETDNFGSEGRGQFDYPLTFDWNHSRKVDIVKINEIIQDIKKNRPNLASNENGILIPLQKLQHSELYWNDTRFWKTGTGQGSVITSAVKRKNSDKILQITHSQYDIWAKSLHEHIMSGNMSSTLTNAHPIKYIATTNWVNTMMLHEENGEYYVPIRPGDVREWRKNNTFVNIEEKGIYVKLPDNSDLRKFITKKSLDRMFAFKSSSPNSFKNSEFYRWFDINVLTELSKDQIKVAGHGDFNYENTNGKGKMFDFERMTLTDLLFDPAYHITDGIEHNHELKYEIIDGKLVVIQQSGHPEYSHIKSDYFKMYLDQINEDFKKTPFAINPETGIIEVLASPTEYLKNEDQAIQQIKGLKSKMWDEYGNEDHRPIFLTEKGDEYADSIIQEYADQKLGKMLLYMHLLRIGRRANQIYSRGNGEPFIENAIRINIDKAVELTRHYDTSTEGTQVNNLLDLLSTAGAHIKDDKGTPGYDIIRDHANELKEKYAHKELQPIS